MDIKLERSIDLLPQNTAIENQKFHRFDLSEFGPAEVCVGSNSHNRYLKHKEHALMRNFQMTCYYVAPILPAQLPARLSAEQAVKAGEADNAELEEVRFS